MIEILSINELGIRIKSDLYDCGNAAVIWEQLYAQMMGVDMSFTDDEIVKIICKVCGRWLCICESDYGPGY